jgi:hypothetical protein
MAGYRSATAASSSPTAPSIKIQQVDQGAIIENKRLGAALAFIREEQLRREPLRRSTLGGTLPRAQIHPDNLWALRGLLDCLQRRGEVAEAALIRQRVDFAAARADQPIPVSCFCARRNAA